MPNHQEQRHLPDYTPQQLFAMVGDVARYPEFLPWCSAARILDGDAEPMHGSSMRAELVISFKLIKESYVSNVNFILPELGGETYAIDVDLVRGPFSTLTNNWEFTPHPQGGSTIAFKVEFAFKSRMLEKVIGSLFDLAVNRMVAAFEERAAELYK